MTLLYAHPYDLSADGFVFNSTDQYRAKVKALRNHFGDPVEEFEIQFIDGESIDAELAKIYPLNQSNIQEFFNAVEDWEDEQKYRYIILVGECGYGHEQVADDPDAIDLDLYELSSMRDLAAQFVGDGYFSDIPAALEPYIDLDAIARDLSIDYADTEIARKTFIYRAP